jgi:hypothetical protein
MLGNVNLAVQGVDSKFLWSYFRFYLVEEGDKVLFNQKHKGFAWIKFKFFGLFEFGKSGNKAKELVKGNHFDQISLLLESGRH